MTSYSVFPNDGIRVAPRLIRKVSNADGIPLWTDESAVTEVISQQTARTMMTLLRGVTAHGTGAAAAQLNHPLGGKTGTTSDFTDAWFLGFSPSVTCGVWIGYDSRQSLGEKETGAVTALPIWMTFMKAAIAGKDDEQFPGDEEIAPANHSTPPGPAAPPAATSPATLNRAAMPVPPKPPAPAPAATQPAQPAKPAKPAPRPAVASRGPGGPDLRIRPALPQYSAPPATQQAPVRRALVTAPGRPVEQ
jgi:penicillin-binding protein 1A